MRFTAIVNGIKGIFPLVKKHAPNSITSLAALDALPKGTRLAIDATLLIQRLHFADDSHPSRHILGFHRLIRQMRECLLVPIMVFDNFSQGARLPAKMRENEKRRAKRSTLTIRANMERLRGKRLEALAGAIKEWKDMVSEDRIKVAELMQSWNQEEQTIQKSNNAIPIYSDEFDDAFRLDFDELDNILLDAPLEPNTESALFYEDRSDFLIDVLPREDIIATLPDIPTLEDGSDVWSSVKEAESSTVLYMASKIHHLRRQYGTLLSVDRVLSDEEVDSPTHGIPPETPRQAQMTLAEGSVYRRLQSGTLDTGADVGSLVGASQAETASLDSQQSESSQVEEVKEEEEQSDQLLALTAKNLLMQRSYARSSAPLSKGIFESCATLCSLLKVPVLWTGDGSKSGGRPHEAEALASMLVRDNLADVVVSEDSDVLLYGVPLLRGVMGHKNLEYVDSVNVRKSLFPTSNELTEEEAEKVSQKQMLDFALLCGTDFNRTVPGIGSITALKLIREYKSIDGIRAESLRRQMINQSEKKKGDKTKKTTKETVLFATPDNLRWREYSKELNEARRVFENPPSLYWEARKLRQAEAQESIDYEALSQFLRTHDIAPREAPLSSNDSSGHAKNDRNSSHPSQFSPQSAITSRGGFGESPFGDGSGAVANWTS